MFGDENQNKLTISNAMKIAIVDSEGNNNELYGLIFDKIGKEFEDKLKISYIYNLNDLYVNITDTKEEKTQGLLNSQWIEEISTLRPSVIILYYYVKEGSTKEEEEIKISKVIEEIKERDQYVFIYLFIIVPPQEYDIYQHLKDDEKSPNAIRKILFKDFIYIFQSKEIWKTIELAKLCNSLIICSRNYYKQLKESIRNKKNESMHAEEFIKYDIMMGILSTIKSKKKEACVSKHLKEAYDIICSKSFDHKKYLYGNPEKTKENFFEIRAIADWLLFKIMKLNFKITENSFSNKKKNQKIVKQKNLDVQTKIDIFYNHIRIFSSFDYGDKEKEGDPYYFYRYFWTYKRYLNLVEFFEKNIKELTDEKKYIHKIGLINFYILYIFMKMIKFYKKYFKDIDMTKVKIKDKEVSINLITTSSSIYYAKPPQFVFEDQTNGEKIEIGYDEEIYLKKVIINNDLTLDKMLYKLKNEHIPNILVFFNRAIELQKEYEVSNGLNDFVVLNKNNLLKDNDMKGLEIYLNMLRLNTIKEGIEKNELYKYSDINDTMFDIYNNFDKSLNIKKFPKIYMNFMNKFTESLIYQMENTKENEKFNNIKKTSLFKCLSILASIKLLNEKEQDVFNKLLDDGEFVPIKYTNNLQENFLIENNNENEDNDNINEEKDKNEDVEKNIEKNYTQKDDIVIKINNYSSINNNGNSSILFEYNIKDIEKSQERKILDLVEYEFKVSTQLEKLKLKFDNIKIFFICINEETNESKNKTKKEVVMKEFTKEELLNCELSKDTPIILEHKIFLKYKKGKIYASKILATVSQKKNIIYLIEFPSEFNKVIFIKNLSKNVLNFNYKKSGKVGKNQYNPFELEITKEKIDEVEIKDLKIEFETIPSFELKEASATHEKKEISPSPREESASEQFENYSSNSLTFAHQRPSVKIEKEKKLKEVVSNLNAEDIESLKRSSFGPNAFKQLNKRTSSNNLDITPMANKLAINNNPVDVNANNNPALKSTSGKTSSPTFNSRSTNFSQKRVLPPPEFYIYNQSNNILEKYIDKMEKKYNDFETLLNNGINKYTTLIKFLQEGSYKIKLSIDYFIRHKEIEDFFEYKEEYILDYNVVKPFVCLKEIATNNYLNIDLNKFGTKQNQNDQEKEKRLYVTNSKIKLNFILHNKIDEDIQIKDIIIQTKENLPIKYINSYLNDLIHIYDIDEEEKNEILVIKKNSNYGIPFDTEFTKAFNGSIGNIKIIWNTKRVEQFEEGKLNLLNEDEFDFPLLEVRPLEFEYIYKTEVNEDNEINLNLSIKNISNKSKQIMVIIGNNEENYENGFVIIGMSRQNHIIREREIININYTLVPLGRGEFDYPYIKIVEKDFATREKIYSNYYFYEKIAII